MTYKKEQFIQEKPLQVLIDEMMQNNQTNPTYIQSLIERAYEMGMEEGVEKTNDQRDR